jgi:prefoldin subunit 5
MKKITLLLFVASLLSSELNAQTFNEWFRQKATQKKYLLQQIAALQVYIGYAKKGYNIVSSAIHTIRDIKKRELNLHNTYFNSLKIINPKISHYAKVADIITYQVRIIKMAKQTLQSIREAHQFTREEVAYCKKVFDTLLDECVESIDELLAIITPDKLTMKDNERLVRIDKLYLDMQDKFTFCSIMSEDIAVLALQRTNEKMEINQSKLINGIK